MNVCQYVLKPTRNGIHCLDKITKDSEHLTKLI